MRGRRESTGRPGALGPALPERSLFRHLVRDARPFSWHLAVILALSLVSAPLALLTPVPLKVAIDSAVGSHPPPGWLQPIMGTTHASILVGVVVLLVGIALLSELQQLLLAQMRAYTGEQLVMSLRTRLFGHLQRLSLSYHDTRGTPDSVYRVQYDAQAIKNVAVDGFIPFIAAGFTLVGMIIVTARIDHQLALVALAISPPLFFIVRVYRRRLRRGSRGVKRLESQALGVVQEVLTVLRVVKTFGQEQREEERFVQCSREGMGARLRLVFVEGVFGLLVGLITVLGTGAVLLIGVGHVRSGALTLGSLLLVLGYIAQLYDPLKTMSKQVTQVQDSMASAERVYALLETQPEVLERNGAQSLVRASGRLQFDCVSFAYEGRAAGLRNVSFEIAPGTRLGIEGVTGAGKTTLVSLIARFYDPSAGRILLDGVDLRDYRLADVRRQVSYVLQEPVLFATTIRENIAYARPDANEQDLVAAAQAACAHEFITALPDGYDTTVGERGMQLSGGERQRLSLARAFLKDAPILILDEPTSALDAATEAELFAAQERVMQGRTSIVVAHRPRLLEGCDLRVRIEAGTLVLLTGVPHRTRGSRPHSARPALAEQRHVGKRPSTGSAKPAALSHDASHPTAATQEPADSGRTRASLPPTTVIEQARRLLGAGRGAPELVESQTLDRGVYRLRFELHGRRESLVVKRLSRRRARVNEMVARRWLPREGMASACPRSRAIVRGDLDDEKVWQIYEDVGGRGLDSFDADPMAVELVVELIAQLHLRFASCPVLGDCRTYGDDLGIAFFDRNVGRCLRYLSCFEAIAAKLSPDHRELRDRLLDRMERLARERDQRARLFDAVGGPSTLLHGDLWTSNTLITGEDDNCGARLIDWDHAGAGPVSYDLSTFLLRFAPDDRFWVLAKYRDVVARAGWQLPTNDELNVLFDTAECARDASCLVEAVVAAARGEPWGFPQMAEIERWFANITPTIASEP